MAYEESLKNLTLLAGEDLSASQYRFVRVGTGAGAFLTAAGGLVCGVLQNAPISGLAATVAEIQGISKLVCASGTAQGASLKSATSGLATTASTGEQAYAIALADSTNDANIIPALLYQHTAL